MNEVQAAAARAADWLEAHPDRHIKLNLAEDKERRLVSTLSPEAHRFCAIGRLSAEIGYDTTSITLDLEKRIGGAYNTSLLRKENDDGIREGDKSRGIKALRDLAQGVI